MVSIYILCHFTADPLLFERFNRRCLCVAQRQKSSTTQSEASANNDPFVRAVGTFLVDIMLLYLCERSNVVTYLFFLYNVIHVNVKGVFAVMGKSSRRRSLGASPLCFHSWLFFLPRKLVTETEGEPKAGAVNTELRYIIRL